MVTNKSNIQYTMWKEDMRDLFTKALVLAGNINGHIFIRLVDQGGYVCTYSSSDSLWQEYCTSGIKLTNHECRSDVDGSIVDNLYTYPLVVSPTDNTKSEIHELCEGQSDDEENNSSNCLTEINEDSVISLPTNTPTNKNTAKRNKKSRNRSSIGTHSSRRSLRNKKYSNDGPIDECNEIETLNLEESHVISEISKTFDETQTINNKNSGCKPKVKFKCNKCDEAFKNKKSLNKHLKSSLKCSRPNSSLSGSENEEKSHSIEAEHTPPPCINNPYTCKKCLKSFSSQVTLDLHIKSIICDKFKCNDCNLLFTTKDEMIEHKFEKHKKDLFQCYQCAKTFSSKAHLRCHNNVHIGRYMCPKCKKYFPEKRNMTQHRCKAIKGKQNLTFKPLICEECKCTFSMKEEVVVHNSIYHSGQTECLRCKVVFNSRQLLMDHLKICKSKLMDIDGNKDENSSSIIKRGKKLLNKMLLSNRENNSIANHVLQKQLPDQMFDGNNIVEMAKENNFSDEQSQINGEVYTAAYNPTLDDDNDKQCSWCKQQFEDSGELLKHVISCAVLFGDEASMKSGANENNTLLYNDNSDITFDVTDNGKEATELYDSYTIHDSESLFTCNDCGQSYVTKSQLIDHMNSHLEVEEELREHNNQPQYYQCFICEMKFNSVVALKSHKLTHTQGMYQCDLCGKTFQNKSNLRSHSNVHVKSYMCTICKIYFTEESHLQGHMCCFIEECSVYFKPIECEVCGIGLSDEFEQKCHNSIHHSDVYRCCKCGESHPEQKALMEHLRLCNQNNEKQANKCNICGTTFASKLMLNYHINVHLAKHKCVNCHICLIDTSSLESHISVCSSRENMQSSPITQVVCETCNYYFNSEQEYFSHNNIHHLDTTGHEVQDKHRLSNMESEKTDQKRQLHEVDYQCDLCGRNFSSKAYLKCHNNIHIGRYQCEHCKRCFSETRHLNTHLSRCDSNSDEGAVYQAIYCNSCKIYFPTDIDLKHHNRFFHNAECFGNNNFNCLHCEKAMGNQKKLMKHLQTCNYRVGKKTSLKEVIGEELHTEIVIKKQRKFVQKTNKFSTLQVGGKDSDQDTSSKIQCPTCFKYYTLSYFECHMRTHTNERPYKCPQCPKSFKFKNHIINHAITHIKDRPYVCEVCGKCFPHPLYLKFHKNMHIRPCKCEICGKTFSTNPQVKRHKLTEHEGRKQHQCDMCGKCYSRSPALAKHKLAHHNQT